MQIILLENIEGLGRKGDQVKVREGFGRNHLLPQRKAVQASADVLSRLGAMKKKFAVEEAKIVGELKGVAVQLEGMKLELMMRATPEGHLFGSVSAKVLAAAAKEKGVVVADRDFRIKEPIKEIGTYEVGIHLHADVQIKVTVVVNADEASAAAIAAKSGGDDDAAPVEDAPAAPAAPAETPVEGGTAAPKA